MKLFLFDEWANKTAQYENAIPPVWHTKDVQDACTAVCGVFWSISYILMAKKSFKDKSYSMPIYCLCLNITWEAVYGFIYGSGTVNIVVYSLWMILDIFLFYATVKYGPHEWRHAPLIAQNLPWLVVACCVFCFWVQLAAAASFIPHLGRNEMWFMTAWPMQLIINIGSTVQILSRGHSGGHSYSIWFTRMIGTVFAGIGFHWQAYFWPEEFGYSATPYGETLLIGSYFFDMCYPIALSYVKRAEKDGVHKTSNGHAKQH